MARLDLQLAENIHENLVAHIMEHYDRYYYFAYSLVKNPEGALNVVCDTTYFSLYNGRKLQSLPLSMHVWFFQLIVRDGMRTMNSKTYPREFTKDSQLYAFMETIEPSAVNAFKLFYFEGLNREKTADALNLSTEEVRKRLEYVRGKLKIDSSMDAESQNRLDELHEVYESPEIPDNLEKEIRAAIKREEENFAEFAVKYKKNRVRKPVGLLLLTALFFFATIFLGRRNPDFAAMVLRMPLINKVFMHFF